MSTTPNANKLLARESKKLRQHSRLAISLIVLGIVAMVAIGYVEDDPTIPPLVMIVLGSGWLFRTRRRIRSLKEANK